MKRSFVLFFTFLIASHYLFGQTIQYVTTDNLNFRSSPEINETNIISKLSANEKVEVITSGDPWTKVKYNNTTGYVSKIYLSSAPVSDGKVIEGYVLICNSSGAYAYHKYQCSGLNKCTHSISTIRESEAKNLQRTPCKICYKGSQTNTYTSQGNTKTYSANSGSSTGGCSAVQCSGITQKGLRCKNRTTNCSGRCYHH